ncbi:flagellar export chaperone FliS [Rheinheimera metallidurans]|uniref:flagellar export chaperone FliS n=1 Tax=Rheinheimera metallidurans TaxID=2925781 RepID=UPI003001B12B
MSYGIKAYKAVGIKDDLAVADPHRVIQLLMQGALENLAKAKGSIERNDYAGKSSTISRSISIISALQGSLDMNAGEISDNLFSLYDFMLNHLIQASREKNIAKLDEVMEILLVIKGAWDQISVSDREKGYQLQAQANQQQVVGA